MARTECRALVLSTYVENLQSIGARCRIGVNENYKNYKKKIDKAYVARSLIVPVNKNCKSNCTKSVKIIKNLI